MAAAVWLLAGCGGAGASSPPTWVPKPQLLPPVGPEPQLPGGNSPPPGQDPNQPGGPQQPGEAGDPNVVATKLREPWGLAVLPDGTAIVGERTTGRILRVFPDHSPAKELMRIGGLEATGDGGLLGITLSPAYREDRLVFAYVTTRTDNRVVRFELGAKPTPILTGIPKGRTDNGGRIAFGPDGLLYVGTGDVGKPDLAQDPKSLAGKVLRVNQFGKPAPDNPDPKSAVYSSGHRDVLGLCWTDGRELFEVEPGRERDELNRVEAGQNYGWPTLDGTGGTGLTGPRLTFRGTTMPTDCAVLGFGLFVVSLPLEQLYSVPLDGRSEPGSPRTVLDGTYGRLRTVEAGGDGALWLTTANRDGHGQPVPDDDRVIRILPPSGSTTSPV